jgi:hypothetical protein
VGREKWPRRVRGHLFQWATKEGVDSSRLSLVLAWRESFRWR